MIAQAFEHHQPNVDLIELVDRIRRNVQRRAGCSVFGLVVETDDDRIVVRGTTQSFYAWQIVLAACREAMTNCSTHSLDCAIKVANEFER